MTLPIDLIQFLRGPYSLMDTAVGVLPEGEPCEAGIVTPDNTVFEMLWLGGHDGENKLVGGGFQTTNGQPQFDAPVGAALLDPATCTLWVSTQYAVSGAYSYPYGTGQWCPISESGGGGIVEIDTQTPILGGPITAGQTGTIRHATSGVSPGTYTSVTVDAYGHVTAGGSASVSNRQFYYDTKVGTTSAAEVTLSGYTYTFPAGSLQRGDCLRVRAWGSFDAEGHARLYLGGNAIISCGNTSGAVNQGFSLEFELIVGTTTGGNTSVSVGGTAMESTNSYGAAYIDGLTVPDLGANSLTIELKGAVDPSGTEVWARGMVIFKE